MKAPSFSVADPFLLEAFFDLFVHLAHFFRVAAQGAGVGLPVGAGGVVLFVERVDFGFHQLGVLSVLVENFLQLHLIADVGFVSDLFGGQMSLEK